MPLAGGPDGLRDLGVQLALFQPGRRADYTHQVTTFQPDFEDLKFEWKSRN